jgi:hypothetical protein
MKFPTRLRYQMYRSSVLFSDVHDYYTDPPRTTATGGLKHDVNFLLEERVVPPDGQWRVAS